MSEENILKITPLGAGSEVGRSCIILSFKNKKLMLDCGIHPAYQGLAALPYFDEIDPSEIDAIFITHFHLDHVASLPYFLEKTNFKGKVYMTHPTKAIYKWLLLDYVKVSHISPEDNLFDEKDLIASHEKITAVDYHQEVEIEGGIKFNCYNAGHVLGAAMFLIEIAGVKILYTGDYSREEDRHLIGAELPIGRAPDIMICESTYGVQSHEPRAEREKRFTSLVHEIVQRGGRCLLPVFALGKAQELLLILDEYWQAHPELQKIPIYYASSLAKKCLAIYQTYLNMMNPTIRKSMTSPNISNPFVFKFISNIKNMESFEDTGPCVMMASPGMLQNGLSRELFDAWCTDKKNGIIISGYSVEGTLANHILNQPSEIVSMNGAKLRLNMTVEYISFSAHVDFIQNSQFIDALKPRHLVLVHGDINEMSRLRHTLQRKYTEKDMCIYTPRNCETISIAFQEEKLAKVIGSLASQELKDNQPLEGILINKDFEYQIMSPSDLSLYTNLKTSTIQQFQWIQVHCPFHLILYQLKQMFGSSQMQVSTVDGFTQITVLTDITVEEKNKTGKILIRWTSSPLLDLMVDSIVALILAAEASPVSVKLTKHDHHHHPPPPDDAHLHEEDTQMKVDEQFNEGALFEKLLLSYFESVKRNTEDMNLFSIDIDEKIYTVHLSDLTVQGPEEKMIHYLKDILTLFKTSTTEDLILPIASA